MSTASEGTIADLMVVVSSAEQTAPLRRAVLRPNNTIEQMIMPGDQTPETTYLAVRDSADDGLVVGCLRLEPVPCPWTLALTSESRSAWQLRAMATDPGMRGRGIGRLLVEAAAEHVSLRGGDLIWCNARVSAEGFYARLGFRTVTDPFAVSDVPEAHVGMVRGSLR